MSVPAELAAGVIHDIGYRHYEGVRQGRWRAMLALYLHSLRGMYGLGRPARAKVVPVMLFVITCAPGVVSGALAAMTPIAPIPYAHYAIFLQLPIMVFTAAQAPQVVTGDLRFQTLSLYFSRPLERSDYVWAKLAAIASAVLVLVAAPLLVIYAVLLLSRTHALADAVTETGRLLVGLGGAGAGALLLAAIGMAISSLTRVRAFAIVAIIGLYLVTTAVSGIMLGVTRASAVGRAFGLISPFSLLDGSQSWAFRTAPAAPPGPGDLGWAFGAVTAALFVAAVVLLQLRYRRIAS